MKNLKLNVILLIAIAICSCSVDEEITDNNSQNSIDSSTEVFVDNESLLVDKFDNNSLEFPSNTNVNTGLTKLSLAENNSKQVLSDLVNAADILAEENVSFDSNNVEFQLKFFYQGDYLYVTRTFTSEINNQNKLIDDGCGNYEGCTRSDNARGVINFIVNLASKSECFEILIEREEFFSKIYGSPCK